VPTTTNPYNTALSSTATAFPTTTTPFWTSTPTQTSTLPRTCSSATTPPCADNASTSVTALLAAQLLAAQQTMAAQTLAAATQMKIPAATTPNPTVLITPKPTSHFPGFDHRLGVAKDAEYLAAEVESALASFKTSYPAEFSSSPYLFSSEDLRGKTASTRLPNQFSPQYPAPDFRESTKHSWKPRSSASNVFGRDYGDFYENDRNHFPASVNNNYHYYINSTVQ
jgi:hypothetical protein